MNAIREAMNNLPGHWHQGIYSDGKTGHWSDEDATNFCGIGHMLKAAGASYIVDVLDEYNLMNEVAGELYPERTCGENNFPRFNDHSDTTEEDVLAVMEKAAIRFEEMI